MLDSKRKVVIDIFFYFFCHFIVFGSSFYLESKLVECMKNSRKTGLNKTLISCVVAFIAVIAFVAILRSTLHSELHPTKPVELTVSNGIGNTEPVHAFKSTEALSDYLIASAAHSAAKVSRLVSGTAAVALEPQTRVTLQGTSGPGQVRVTVVSGAHRGESLYISYATVDSP